MEGVGARLGRSSSRYVTTTVFTGPVRKWKKDWILITPPSSSSASSSNNNNPINQNHHQSSSSNGGSINGTNNGSVSHLRLYKWTPLSNKDRNSSPDNNQNNADNESPTQENSKQDNDNVLEAPPKKKFKYIPIAVLEEQKKEEAEAEDEAEAEAEAEENADEEAKRIGANENTEEQASKTDGLIEKPDINDVPMEEIEDTEEKQTALGWQDLNESLDLSLGLTSHEGEHDSGSKINPTKEE